MPHRPIGSRWRALADVPFGAIRPGHIVRVVRNVGADNNIIINETTGREPVTGYALGNNYFEPAPEVAIGAPEVAPVRREDVAPEPAPPTAVFTPNEDERYFIFYRGHAHRNDGRNHFQQGSISREAMTLGECRDQIRNRYAAGYEYFIVPARAVEHYTDGGARMALDADYGVRINDPEAA